MKKMFVALNAPTLRRERLKQRRATALAGLALVAVAGAVCVLLYAINGAVAAYANEIHLINPYN